MRTPSLTATILAAAARLLEPLDRIHIAVPCIPICGTLTRAVNPCFEKISDFLVSPSAALVIDTVNGTLGWGTSSEQIGTT